MKYNSNSTELFMVLGIMADIPEVESTDPLEMLAVGRRHLAVKDYSSAVTSLGKACELLAEKYGQQADECGEAYFW